MTAGRVNASARKTASEVARAPPRSATPRTRAAWCAGCRRGRSSRRARPRRGRRRAAAHSDAQAPTRSRTGRCPGSVSGVLRVLDRPVGPAPEPLGARGPMDGRASTGTRCPARPRGRARARDQRVEVGQVPRSGCTAVWPPSLDPMAQGSRGRPAPEPACCRAPCGTTSRWDGSAAGRGRRSPSRRRSRGGPRGRAASRPATDRATWSAESTRTTRRRPHAPPRPRRRAAGRGRPPRRDPDDAPSSRAAPPRAPHPRGSAVRRLRRARRHAGRARCRPCRPLVWPRRAPGPLLRAARSRRPDPLRPCARTRAASCRSDRSRPPP